MISNPVLPVNENGTNGDFWDTLRRKGHGYPEQDLLLAVLKDALVNYRKRLRQPNKTFHADRAWFFENESDRLFSFESVCAALGLSAARIRQHLLAWERESLTLQTQYVCRDGPARGDRSDVRVISAARRIESSAF